MDRSNDARGGALSHKRVKERCLQARANINKDITTAAIEPAVAHLVNVGHTRYGTIEDHRRRRAVWKRLYAPIRKKLKPDLDIVRSRRVQIENRKHSPAYARCQISTAKGCITVNDLHPNGLPMDDLAYWPMWETSDSLPGCLGYGFKDGVPTSTSVIMYMRDRGGFQILRRSQNALAAKEHADRLLARSQQSVSSIRIPPASDQAGNLTPQAKFISFPSIEFDYQRQMEELRIQEDLLELQRWNPEFSFD